MIGKRGSLFLLLALSLFLPPGARGALGDEKKPPQGRAGDASATGTTKAKAHAPVDAARVRAAIRRGTAFLCRSQNEDGSWGSHDPVVADSAQLGFSMLNFGCHDGVRTGCTAICAKALLRLPERTAAEEAALRRAVRVLLATRNLAYDPGNAFNVWGYAYNLDFLTALQRDPFGKPYRKEIRAAVPDLVRGLRRMQVAEGGWAYYTSVMMEGSSISFITATVLLGLLEARDEGFEVPEGMIADAGKILKTMVLPNKNVIYGTYLKYAGGHYVEDLGHGGRTQVAGLALHRFDGSFTGADLADRSMDYFKNVDYVAEIGNKRIIPHRDAPHNISGYFLYYGLYYGAEVMAVLGKKTDPARWDKLARIVLEHQEGNGSWWDTMCFGYGDKWGTGFALLCLERWLEARGGTEVPPSLPAPFPEHPSRKDKDKEKDREGAGAP